MTEAKTKGRRCASTSCPGNEWELSTVCGFPNRCDLCNKRGPIRRVIKCSACKTMYHKRYHKDTAVVKRDATGPVKSVIGDGSGANGTMAMAAVRRHKVVVDVATKMDESCRVRVGGLARQLETIPEEEVVHRPVGNAKVAKKFYRMPLVNMNNFKSLLQDTVAVYTVSDGIQRRDHATSAAPPPHDTYSRWPVRERASVYHRSTTTAAAPSSARVGLVSTITALEYFKYIINNRRGKPKQKDGH